MTLAEALQYAADRLDAATKTMLAIRDQIAQQLASTTGQATTIINNFINRPPTTNVYCDPVDGSDANDGLTIATPKKSLDAIIAAAGANPTQVFLFGDTTLRQRNYTFAPIYIIGVQRANNANGYIYFRRTISFLGVAENSPDSSGSTFSAGIFSQSATIRTVMIDFTLPDVPAGLSYPNHIHSFVTTDCVFETPTLKVGSQNAAALLGTSGRLILTAGMTFGPGAAGHLFQGIPAGGDPNSVWAFASNIKSA